MIARGRDPAPAPSVERVAGADDALVLAFGVDQLDIGAGDIFVGLRPIFLGRDGSHGTTNGRRSFNCYRSGGRCRLKSCSRRHKSTPTWRPESFRILRNRDPIVAQLRTGRHPLHDRAPTQRLAGHARIAHRRQRPMAPRYRRPAPRRAAPGLFWLNGYRSDMLGSKARGDRRASARRAASPSPASIIPATASRAAISSTARSRAGSMKSLAVFATTIRPADRHRLVAWAAGWRCC